MSDASTNDAQRARLQDAVRSIRRLQKRVAELEAAAHESIAVVGLGCRLPGGIADPAAYWRLLEEGVDAVGTVPPDRWDAAAYYDPDPEVPGKMYTLAGGFMDGVDRFDADLFGLSPREVAKIDPQHRIVLEVAWEALEHAGIPPRSLAESATGVYLGITAFDYGVHLSHVGESVIDAYTMTGTKLNFASGRLAYVLGLQGPALSIDTACSSSLVAIHLACQGLRRGDCEMALAGGVNAMLTPEQTIAECKMRMLSPSGRCKTFDAGADGFVRGEGCGMLVLERLETARKHGHPIIAVIRGSAVNQDGPSSGPTVPNRIAQEKVIRRALEDARVDAADIDYVEAHGTGTQLGDPIEVRALANVFGAGGAREAPLRIGSVKTNFGHLESASGVAGLMKTVLGLQHGVIPPHLHVRTLNPAVDWASIPIEVVTERQGWPVTDRPRRAGVSSFGASGTNAHIVLEEWRPEAIDDARVQDERPVHVYCLSGATAGSLKAIAGTHSQALADLEPGQLADACHTVGAGRSHFRHRLAVIGEDFEQVCSGLDAFGRGEISAAVLTGVAARTPRIAFLFPGRSGHVRESGRELYETSAVFRARLDECDELLRARIKSPLRDLLFGGDTAKTARPGIAEPALVALQYALGETWRAYGIEPAAMLGHGTGEYAAACLAGVLSISDVLTLAIARGALLESLPESDAMAVVSAGPDRVAQAIDRRRGVSVAAINSPDSVVISGDAGELGAALTALDRAGLPTGLLDVSRALQSPRVLPLLDEFAAAVGNIDAATPRKLLVSSITGNAVTGDQRLDLEYWKRQLVDVVRFNGAVRTLGDEDISTFVEIGPGATLTRLARRCLAGRPATWVSSLEAAQHDWRPMTRALAQLYASGADVDWEAVDSDFAVKKLRLPAYAFDRKRHWIDLPSVAGSRSTLPAVSSLETGHPLLGRHLRSPLETVQFESELGIDRQNWLADHRVFGRIVVPATAYLEMLLAAASHGVGSDVVLEDIVLRAPIVIDPHAATTVQVLLDSNDETRRLRIFTQADPSASDAAWTEHVSANCMSRCGDDYLGEAESLLDVQNIQARCPDDVAIDGHYRALAESGVEFGPAFRTVDRIRRGDRESIGWLRAPDGVELTDASAYWLHPAILDGCLQVAREALPESARDDHDVALVPMRLGRLVAAGRPGTNVVCHAQRVESANAGTAFEIDLVIATAAGERLAELRGLRLARVDNAVIDAAAGGRIDSDIYRLEWRSKPLAATTAPVSTPRRWLLFGYDDPLAIACCDKLRASGESVLAVKAGERLEIGEHDCTLRVDHPGDIARLIDETVGQGDASWTIVHAGGAVPGGAEPSAEELHASQAVHLQSLLHVAQALESCPVPVTRLIVMTCGAQGTASAPGLAGAPLWGFGRVMQIEFPRLDTVLLDLDDVRSAPAQLLAEARADIGEDQILYRHGERFVGRLAPAGSGITTADDAGPWRLELEMPGLPDSLTVRRMQRHAPGSGEVEIEVAAAGLNFRDVLVALGVYQGEAGPLGGECAGRVVAVGGGVDSLAIGDEVIAFTGGSMASHVLADARLVWHKPASLSFQQAATLPIAFLTAAYCLEELGHLQRGQRVLIHGAAGGVGMAATQLARRAGAEIFGTAGTPEKRELIESLGVAHALDSRSLEFADRIMELTDGDGVDLVLNSLAGEFIPQSLRVTRNGGRFVEIGRTDIWDAEQVEQYRPGIRYHTVLLGDIGDRDPELIRRLGQQLVADIEAGELTPLPVRAWPITRAADAFHLMARAGHTGKIVLTNERFARESGDAAPTVRTDGGYLITGGFGGLGLEVARWLAERGARLLILLGRHGADDRAKAAIAAMGDGGTTVLPVIGDVTSETDLRRALDLAAEHEIPLRGVVHAAGTLDDGVLAEQDWSRIDDVLAAKMTGAWLLHRLTQGQPLDFFVLFSSASALLGAAGQAGYAAGNAFLDVLARWRHQRGQPALSINWGPWADVGMFVDSGEAGRRAVSDRGFKLLDCDRNLAALETLLSSHDAGAGVFTADWEKYIASRERTGVPPLLSELVSTSARANAGPDAGALAAEIAAAPSARRHRLLQNRLREEVATVLSSDADSILTNQGFRELGMDSLMSVELRNRLERLLGCSLTSTLAFDYPSIESLAEYLLKVVVAALPAKDTEAPVSQPATSVPDDDIDGAVAELSDDEAEQVLVAELNRIREADRRG